MSVSPHLLSVTEVDSVNGLVSYNMDLGVTWHDTRITTRPGINIRSWIPFNTNMRYQ